MEMPAGIRAKLAMQSPDPESEDRTRLPIPPEPHDGSTGAISLPTNTKEVIEPLELLLLREFFLLLDEWDGKQPR